MSLPVAPSAPAARHLIGYWHTSDDRCPHPQVLVDPQWEITRRAAIVRYLRSAVVIRQYLGWSYCRFGCPEANGMAELGDDAWQWPEGLAHYVERHLIRLPDEFVAHAASRDFQPIRNGRLSSDSGSYSGAFWSKWCQQHAPFRHETSCHACNPPVPHVYRPGLGRLITLP